MAWGSGGPEDAAIEAEIEAEIEADAAEAEAAAVADAYEGYDQAMNRNARENALLGHDPWGSDYSGRTGALSSQGISANMAAGAHAALVGRQNDEGLDRWGRSKSDMLERAINASGGIGSGRNFGGSTRQGLLDSGWDDDEAYEGEMMDAYSGLLDGGNDFYDEDEDYQGEMMDAYDYDPNLGTRVADFFERNNPLFGALRALGFNPKLDRTLGTANRLDAEGNRIGESTRDDSAAEWHCGARGGTWDGGQCVMPNGNGDGDGNGDDDDGGGDIDYGKFGKPNPFASLTRKRQMFYHPMMGGTAHGNVYDPYSGERPDYIDENIWDYKPPRAGAEFKNWATDLRNWASGS